MQPKFRISELHWKHDGECWTWTGRTNASGRPVCYVEGAHELPQRLLYQQRCLAGDLDLLEPNVVLVPLCGNARCVNPEHLVPADGEAVPSPRGDVNRTKTSCPAGHPYSGPNLRVSRDGRRHCRKCSRERSRRWLERRRETVMDDWSFPENPLLKCPFSPSFTGPIEERLKVLQD